MFDLRIEHVHIHASEDAHSINKTLATLLRKVDEIMATQAEHLQGLKDITAQLNKISAESTANLEKLAALEQAIQDAGNTSPEIDAAMDDLRSGMQALDDKTPDLPPAGDGGGIPEVPQA